MDYNYLTKKLLTNAELKEYIQEILKENISNSKDDSTSDFDLSGEDSLCIANELVSISKYPFRENTWIGNMHTINTSPDFQNRFGYDFFLFMYSGMTTNVSGVGKVDFLNIIPLYKEERERIVKNGPEKLLLDLVEKYGEEAFTINKLRDIIIPSK